MFTDEEDAEGRQSKKRKLAPETSVTCILCQENDSPSALTQPASDESWKTLVDAATIHDYEPVLSLSNGSLPDCPVYYHRRCRAIFTHRKTLSRKAQQIKDAEVSNLDDEQRRSCRQWSSGSQKICIICKKQSKYIKTSRTREPLVQSVDLRADESIRAAASAKCDSAMIAATSSRDIVAAEACYHKSCYIKYTRHIPDADDKQEETSDYIALENTAYEMLYDNIQQTIFKTPDIVYMSDYIPTLTEYMTKLGITNTQQSTKKKMRRKLECKFGDRLSIFPDERGKLLMVPNNLNIQDLAKHHASLREELSRLKQNKRSRIPLEEVAKCLRSDVRAIQTQQPWPPNPEDLHEDFVQVPDSLQTFLQCLLSAEEMHKSDRVDRLVWSIAQDIIYGVTAGGMLTSKQILLPWAVKTLTGNVELIKMLNRLGHGISYSKLMEIDTALCLQKLAVENDRVALPANVHPCVPTTLAYDNIDRLEETLSGDGTSHRVNGIIIQPTVSTALPQAEKELVPKEKKRSIKATTLALPQYIAGRRCGPPALASVEPDAEQQALAASMKNLIWCLLRQQNHSNQTVSSWTGFNIMTHKKPVSVDKVNYLPTINAPATQLSTVYEVLNQAKQIKETLNLRSIVVVFDQALYAKACEVIWKHPSAFTDIVLRMGTFHTLCNFMSIIGKRFADAGLKDIVVESGIIAEGSISGALEGRKYNRALRMHKLLYEALLRLAWTHFEPWLRKYHQAKISKYHTLLKLIEEIHGNASENELQRTLADENCQEILDTFTEFLQWLRSDCGHLASFWMSYVDMVDTLLGLIRAAREGDWILHLHYVRKIIPWCFAYDKQNYARYLSVYFAQMSQLQSSHPDVYQHMMQGGLSVKMSSHNSFGGVPVDQTIEETVNKDTQTAGGTKGFSLKPSAICKYYLTAEYRSICLKKLREIVSTQTPSWSHPDLQPSRIKRDEADVQSVQDLFQTWTNPFSDSSTELVNLATGACAPSDVTDDLIAAYEKGECAYATFQRERLQNQNLQFHVRLPKMQLKTFSSLTKEHVTKVSNRETILKADNRLFGQMVLVASSRNLDMRQVLQYPLGPLPWSLASSDGTMKKTNKASLARKLESRIAPAEVTDQPSASIIDGMSIVQKTYGENQTFETVAQLILDSCLHAGFSSDRVDIVFDVYTEISIKAAERVKRGSSRGILLGEIRPTHTIKNWRRLLACPESKTKLIRYIVESWKLPAAREKIGDRTVYVTCENKCFKLTCNTVEEVDELDCTHEEADTRIMLHAKHASRDYSSLVIVAEDTDVLVLSLWCLVSMATCKLYIKCGTNTRTRMIDVTGIGASLGRSLSLALLGMHAFTGCDSVSAFSGRGKLRGLQILESNSRFQHAFEELGNEVVLSEDILASLEEFTCKLYTSQISTADINELRYHIFRSKQGNTESDQLPPCKDCLVMHAKRANYQAYIWKRCFENRPCIPEPHRGHGWKLSEDGLLDIIWMTGLPAPDMVMELLSCNCTRSCKLPDCQCLSNGLRCSATCKLQNCTNMPAEDDFVSDECDEDENDE